MSKNWIYKNKLNPNKYLEVKKYKDGHYMWKRSITLINRWGEPTEIYLDCPPSKQDIGLWKRVTKSKLLDILKDYKCIYEYEESLK